MLITPVLIPDPNTFLLHLFFLVRIPPLYVCISDTFKQKPSFSISHLKENHRNPLLSKSEIKGKGTGGGPGCQRRLPAPLLVLAAFVSSQTVLGGLLDHTCHPCLSHARGRALLWVRSEHPASKGPTGTASSWSHFRLNALVWYHHSLVSAPSLP